MNAPVCECKEGAPGRLCHDLEVTSREVRLPATLLKENDSGRGFAGAFQWAAHAWFNWAFPNHGGEVCDEFNSGRGYRDDGKGNYLMVVLDEYEQPWRFRTSGVDPAEFLVDTDTE